MSLLELDNCLDVLVNRTEAWSGGMGVQDLTMTLLFGGLALDYALGIEESWTIFWRNRGVGVDHGVEVWSFRS